MASDYFLKIDGIDGEADDDKYPKWIAVDSFSWGHSNAGSFSGGTGGGAGKVTFQDISFTTTVNKASASIAQACATGRKFAWVELDVRKAGDTPQLFYTIKLYDVLVSVYQSSGHGGGDGDKVVPHDNFSLSFAKIEYSYGPQDEKGMVPKLDQKMVHDLKTNKSGG